MSGPVSPCFQELKYKRTDVVEKVRDLSSELATLQEQAAALDKVIPLYDPDWKPTEVPRKGKGRGPVSPVRRDLGRPTCSRRQSNTWLVVVAAESRLTPPGAHCRSHGKPLSSCRELTK